MSLFQAFESKTGVLKLQHGASIVLLGSCFSDAMCEKLRQTGHHVMSNPFGTIYHPLSIAQSIQDSLDEVHLVEIVQRKDLFLCWDAASGIWAFSEEEVRDKIMKQRRALRSELSSANLLVLTFGTAFGYHLENGKLVANCHKQEAHLFTKELSAPAQLVELWQKVIDDLKALNPGLEIIFTVSPVRHFRDGLVENNRSKARLIECVHALVEQGRGHYFPSYELLVDHLRDYRFYKQDRIHPSAEAQELIWERFANFIFDESTRKLNETVRKLRREEEHKSLFPGSIEETERRAKLEERKTEVLKAHPGIQW